jgi:PhnB protein
MKTNLHVTFPGTCHEAFAFYESIFHSKIGITMTYGDAPGGSPVPEGSKDLIMHTSMAVGSLLLMGADMPLERREPVGGFEISLETEDEDEARRLYAALSEGGTVIMPLMPTFWTPLFGMCDDKFGVGWMVSIPGPMPS